jgi:hypothetical protein
LTPGLRLISGHVLLICGGGHDHDMAYEQAQRLINEPCWCKQPIVRIVYGPGVPVRIPVLGLAESA